ncbi:MAG: hypothetical protein LBL48_06895 [Azoarcus sp.]|nr:hypothetical protein [Azoarcus sp.]
MIARIAQSLIGVVGVNWAALFFMLVFFSLGNWAGWTANGWRWESRYADLQKTQADTVTEARKAAVEALRKALAAQRRGDALAAQVAADETARIQRAEEMGREIAKLAAGRPCLSADLTRLLNESAARTVARVPSHSGDAAGAAARFATDADVGHWVAGARRQYDNCRGRLDAIRQWNDGLTGGP